MQQQRDRTDRNSSQAKKMIARPSVPIPTSPGGRSFIVPDSGAEGVIVAQGGLTERWGLYAKAGKLKYCYNFYGMERYYVEGDTKVPAGTHEVRMEFTYDGGGLARGGTAAL